MSPEVIRELFILLGVKEDQASFGRAQKAMGDLVSMAKWAATAVGVVAGAFGAVGKQAFDAAELVERWRTRVGGTAKEVSELAAAAKSLGFEETLALEGAVEVSERASDLIRNVKALKGDAGESFKALGFQSIQDLKDADGKMRRPLELFNEVAARLAKVENAGDRTGIAMRMFGDDVGQKLVPALLELADAKKTAADMGAVMSEDDLKQARDLRRSWGRISLGLRGLALTVGRALAPAMKDLLKTAGAWLKTNRAWLKLKVTRATKLFIRATRAAVNVVRTLVADMRPLLNLVGGLEGALKLLAMALGAVLLYKIGAVAVGVAQLGAALLTAGKAAALTAGASALLAAKIVAIGAVIATAVLALEDLWHGLRGGRSVILELLDAIYEGDPKKQPWWVVALRVALRPIREVLKGLRAIKKELSEPGGFANRAINAGIAGAKAGARAMIPGSGMLFDAYDVSKKRGWVQQISSRFDPPAPNFGAPLAGGAGLGAVKITQENTYNIHGGHPQEVQAAVERGTRRGLTEAGREMAH